MSALGAPGRVPPRAPERLASGSRRARRPRARIPRVCPAGGSEAALHQTAPLANGAEGGARVRATRHVVVLCHDVSAPTAAGLFSVSNLLQGRVDVWCRCVTASLYLSDDLRRDTVVSLVLSPPESEDANDGARQGSAQKTRVVTVRGDAVEGLAPAETRVALLLQRATQHASLGELGELGREAKAAAASAEAFRTERNEKKSARNAERRRARWVARRPGSAGPVPGITVMDYPTTEACLNAVLGSLGDVPGSILLLDAFGAPVAEALAPTKKKLTDFTTFVLGDAAGITALERELLMRRFRVLTVTLGPNVLLASHCIVLAHAALDNARCERVDR